MGVKKGRDQLKVCVLMRCSSYRRVDLLRESQLYNSHIQPADTLEP